MRSVEAFILAVAVLAVPGALVACGHAYAPEDPADAGGDDGPAPSGPDGGPSSTSSPPPADGGDGAPPVGPGSDASIDDAGAPDADASTVQVTVPTNGKLVFVTSVAVAGDVWAGGRGAGDDICRLAAPQGLDPARTAKLYAWLGAPGSVDGVAWSTNADYVELDGTVVAHGWPTATGVLLAPIIVDENGGHQKVEVWSGADPSGFVTGNTCSSWSSKTGGDTGTVGYSGTTTVGWANSAVQPCDRAGVHLYCFEH